MPLPNSGLSRIATVTATLALLLIATGALTGGDAAGSTLPASIAVYHVCLAVATGVMAVWLTIRLTSAILPTWLRVTGWAGLALFIIDNAIMAWPPAPPVDAALAVPHAIVATLFFAAMVAVACYMFRDGINVPEMIDISPSPSVPAIADITPLVVILQISLGAAYRHKIFSVMPHLAGTMAATLLLLVACSCFRISPRMRHCGLPPSRRCRQCCCRLRSESPRLPCVYSTSTQRQSLCLSPRRTSAWGH